MIWKTFVIIILVVILFIIFQEGKFVVNNERVGFILLKGGYRAWWIRYSNGLQCLPNDRYKNLWCKPKFEHVDVRRLNP